MHFWEAYILWQVLYRFVICAQINNLLQYKLFYVTPAEGDVSPIIILNAFGRLHVNLTIAGLQGMEIIRAMFLYM